MVEEMGVRASRFFQRVRQDWQAVEGPVVVDGLGDLGDGAVVPRQETIPMRLPSCLGVRHPFTGRNGLPMMQRSRAA